jgi:mannose-6-phosphate isomerase-like protein (cupin superfamily)
MHFKANNIERRDFNAEDAEVFAKDAEKNLCPPLRFPLRPLRLRLSLAGLKPMAGVVLIVGAMITVHAQRKPSEAIRQFVVMPAQSVDDLQKTLQAENKTSELIDSAGTQLRVAVQHERNRTNAAAELHDASDDVYYVLEGSATLVLGGKLENPKEMDPGEWRSSRIIDGKTFEVRKGDLVIVPRGTPHQRSTAGKDFTMILIKIYAEPMKKRP